LQEFGPAHTKGDIVIHLPDAKTVFTGDLLFAGSHPILWAGPIENWITACDTMLSWGVETVVPGHGPISGPEALRDMRDYLKSILDGSKARYEAGLGWEEAAFDLAREMTDTWIERERIIANVANVYRDLSAERYNRTGRRFSATCLGSATERTARTTPAPAAVARADGAERWRWSFSTTPIQPVRRRCA
jgi:cyclase